MRWGSQRAANPAAQEGMRVLPKWRSLKINPRNPWLHAARIPIKRHRGLAQRWRLVSLPNKLIVLATIVIAIANGTYTFVALRTLGEIRSGSKDTHDLAISAGKQADKAETISASIGQAVRAMVTGNKQAKDSMDKANAQNNAALDATIASSHLDQRAWVYVSNPSLIQRPGQWPVITLDIINSGKTPASNVSYLQSSDIQPAGKYPIFQYKGESLPVGSLPPGGKFTTSYFDTAERLTALAFSQRRVRRESFFIYGELSYTDAFGISRRTRYCYAMFQMEENMTITTTCPYHNDGN